MKKTNKKIPKDARSRLWSEIEDKISKRARKKDKKFILKGAWKKYLRKDGAYKIYIVDGEWVKRNLSVIFGHGGHGFVHEFIPLDEIWIDSHHDDCKCSGVRKDRKMSHAYRESTILHEITECNEMKKGRIFWEAHNLALDAERKARLLPDPFTEAYESRVSS